MLVCNHRRSRKDPFMDIAHSFTLGTDRYEHAYVLTVDALDFRLLQRAIAVALAQVATAPETNYTSMLRDLDMLLMRVQTEDVTP